MPPRLRARALVCSFLSVTTLAAGLVAFATPASAAPGHDNTVYAFGAASFYGSTEGKSLAQPIVAMAATANGAGYWLVGKDGGVFGFNAPFFGSLGNFPFPLGAPITGMTATPDGKGYWLVGADGYVYPFGTAAWFGGMNGRHLNAPITALVSNAKGDGYWLYAADGGVFTFGHTAFLGSMGGKHLNAPVVGMTSTPTGKGYWLVGGDGGVFTFGDAGFFGSMGGKHLNAPVVGIARTGNGKGYWLAGGDGGVFTFGSAQFKGSAAGLVRPDRHVSELVGMPGGDGYRMLAVSNVEDVALQGPGATGAAVKYLQLRLLALGYWIPGVDGTYGNLTQQAVYAFQKANRIPRTGVVDSTTQRTFRTSRRVTPRGGSGYLIEIDKTRQILLIVRNGVTQWVLNASTGSDIPYTLDGVRYSAHTPEGVFTVIRQVDGPDHGPLGTLWRPKYFTWTGIAVHGYSNVPPYPASHGCTRVSNEAMNWIWANNVMPLGTTVWVYV
jgi:peptidoglycan hydrolase-like protein with peptidoglycan-binding domain